MGSRCDESQPFRKPCRNPRVFPGGSLGLRVQLVWVYPFRVTGLSCIAALKALGEETRLRILRLLFKEPLGVNEISQRLKVSQYNVSKHLRVMREAGLLEVEKQGKQRLYSVVSDLKTKVEANNNILDLGCCTFRLDKLPR
jgi:DNA-binding transcriptional ArsR family regulator